MPVTELVEAAKVSVDLMAGLKERGLMEVAELPEEKPVEASELSERELMGAA